MERTRFDIDASVKWVTGVLKEPHATARAYQALHAPWQQTFLQITLPVYVAAAVVGFVLSLLFGTPFALGGVAGAPLMFLVSFAWSLALLFVVVFIFDLFAGVFGGRRDYDVAFAALSLAMVPGLLGNMVTPLPFIGWLLGLAAGIYALVLLYQFIPVFMTVPDDKRVLHFVVSLIVAFVVNLLVSGAIALTFGPDLDDLASGAASERTEPGMFGDLERQADFADQAARDTYQPPANGRLSEAQVAAYARTLQRTAELRERLGKKFENLEQEGPSIGSIFSGVGDAVRLGTAEMEVVKTGGGNWQEHLWVKNQLETARVQRDGSPAIEHNYQLFVEYQEQIEQYE